MNTSLSNHHQNIEFFKYLCQSIKREGIDALLLWLEDTDFFDAPASQRYHEAYKGGLVEHSLRVYFELCRLRDIFPDVKITDESIIITSLFHDLCKANFYVESKLNVKVDGKWEEVPYYTIDEQYQFGGHGSKSVYLIERLSILRTPKRQQLTRTWEYKVMTILATMCIVNILLLCCCTPLI